MQPSRNNRSGVYPAIRPAIPVKQEETSMNSKHGINRRTFVKGALASATLGAAGFPAIAQQRTKLRVGYVNTLAVNGQIWTGMHRGHWAKENLELETTVFSTGLELFNAMIGGSLDM